MKYQVVRSTHLNDYLMLNNCLPDQEFNDGAECWYRKTKKFLSLLDSYYVRYGIMGSKI